MLRTITTPLASSVLPTAVPRRTASSQQHSSDTSASAKLWQDALDEEGHGAQFESKSKSGTVAPEYPNWTGDESVQDAVLRMLVDKYKPLRGGAVRTAEDKLKDAPPVLTSHSLPTPASESKSKSESDSTSEHKPWLTTFRAPSHATSIRYMRLPPPTKHSPSTRPNLPLHPDDTRARILERQKKRKAAYAGRITNARESSLDYRIGKHVSDARDRVHHPNPVSIKGWTSLVEERIERARSEGHFRALKGRGKPLAREHEQSNPFIPREEFLMNRIVQRQGAAPPWVEFQAELDAAISSFRGTLESTWTRRAVRSIMLAHPGPGVPPHLTLADVTGIRIRDRAWEVREKGYYEAAIGEINRLVRRYNGAAPYAVRRGYLTREGELERVAEVCGEEILAAVARRREAGGVDRSGQPEGGGGDGVAGDNVQSVGLRSVWKNWIAQFVGG